MFESLSLDGIGVFIYNLRWPAFWVVVAFFSVWLPLVLWDWFTHRGDKRWQGLFRYWRFALDHDSMWWQRARRVEYKSVFYIGKRGRGKSLFLSRHAVKHIKKGRRVLANYQILCPDGEALYWSALADLMRLVGEAFRDGVPFTIVIDEAQNIFDAREWARTPRWFRAFLSELRHYNGGCILMASQAYGMVEKRARQLTDETWQISPMLDFAKHRLALFHMQEITEDPNVADDAEMVMGRHKLVWIRGHNFCAYSTVLLPSDDAVGDGDGCQEIYADLRALLSETDTAEEGEEDAQTESVSGV